LQVFLQKSKPLLQRRRTMKKVIVVTGASSGFGALAARALAKAGHVVYASMRDTSGRNQGQVHEAAKFAADNKADLRTVELDVLSETSANAAVKKIVDDNGRLDVVVHNAGHMVFGPLEAFTPEQLAELYDVNVLSTQRVNRAALPQLRKQKQGLVVWVSSSSSAGGTPPYLALILQRRPGWMLWPWCPLVNSPAGASRLPLSFPARSPEEQTTSLTRAGLPIPSVPLSMTTDRTKALRMM
jgi:NAD(P)-dependent dehydrogenase (short-subunit alcohol dehydrogenase family)